MVEIKNLFYFKLVFVNNRYENPNHVSTFYSFYARVTIGRKASSDRHFCIDSKKISRIHAEISISSTKNFFEIQGHSKNGFLLNGVHISHKNFPQKLKSRDLLQFGDYLVYFLLPSTVKKLSTCDFDEYLALGRIGDPLKEISAFSPHAGEEKMVVYKPGQKEIVKFADIDKREVSIFLSSGNDILKTIIRCLREGKFFLWDEISKEITKTINAELSSTFIEQFALTILSELFRKAFLQGDFRCAQKLASIIREESSEISLKPKIKDILTGFVSKNLEYSPQLANDVILGYFLKCFILGKADEKERKEKLAVASTFSIKGWDIEKDLELLKQVDAEGSNVFDRIDDKKLENHKAFSKLGELLIKTKKNEDMEEMSKKSALKQRFYTLIENMYMRNTKSEHKTCSRQMRHTLHKKEESGFEGKTWNCEEHYALLKILQIFGRPDNDEKWDHIKKSEKQLFQSKSFEQVKKRCELIIKAASEAALGDTESMFGTTIAGARNLVKRFKMFEKLDSKLKTLKPKKLMERLAPYKDLLKIPPWWDKVEFDRDLIIGTLRHGAGNWEQILRDKKLIFHTVPINLFGEHKANFFFGRLVRLEQFLSNNYFPMINSFIKEDVAKTPPHPLMVPSPPTTSSNNQKAFFPPRNRPAKPTEDLKAVMHEGFNGQHNKKFEKKFLPMMVSTSLILVNPGTIDAVRPKYHNQSLIFPIGFKTIRKYFSYKNPNLTCKYINEIFDGGAQPLFIVTCEHDLSHPIKQSNPNMIWEMINSKIKALLPGKNVIRTINGFERFGLSEPAVKYFIENLKNAEKCTEYKKMPIRTRKYPPISPDMIPPPPKRLSNSPTIKKE